MTASPGTACPRSLRGGLPQAHRAAAMAQPIGLAVNKIDGVKTAPAVALPEETDSPRRRPPYAAFAGLMGVTICRRCVPNSC
jgi:hypothetical protein